MRCSRDAQVISPHEDRIPAGRAREVVRAHPPLAHIDDRVAIPPDLHQPPDVVNARAVHPLERHHVVAVALGGLERRDRVRPVTGRICATCSWATPGVGAPGSAAQRIANVRVNERRGGIASSRQRSRGRTSLASRSSLGRVASMGSLPLASRVGCSTRGPAYTASRPSRLYSSFG